MALLSEYKDELICDLAETYGILDWRAHPPLLIATLALGLRPSSRIMSKINGAEADLNIMLLASIADNTAFLAWTKTKDAQHGINRPKSIVNALTSGSRKPDNDILAFDTVEAFEAARADFIAEVKRNVD